MNLRESRFALLDAVNAHDIEGIKAFVDPSYTARGLGGAAVMGYEELDGYVARMLAKHPEYRETLEVESEEVDGETGRLTTRRTERYKAFPGPERTNVSRQVETWKQVEGRWRIVEEQALGSPATVALMGRLQGFLDNSARPRRSVGLLAACAVVLVASFLPWGSIPLAANFDGMPLPFPVLGGVRLTMTGWNGHLSLPGLTVPNWVVVLGAVVIAALHVMASGSGWRSRPVVNILIAAYGVVHGVALALLLLSNQGSISVGLIATVAAYSAALFLLLKGLGNAKPAGVAEV